MPIDKNKIVWDSDTITWDSPEQAKGYVQQTIENVPDSAMQFGKNIYEAVTSPVETVKALGSAGGGLLESLQTEEPPSVMPENKEAYEGMKQMLVGRYGSFDALSDTLKNDPVGFAADMSALLVGGGSLAGRLPGLTGKVGKTAQVVGEGLNPLNVAKEAVTAIPRALTPKGAPQEFAKGMIEKQLKPSTTLPSSTRQEIIGFMLDEGVNVTKGGLGKVEGRLKANNKLFDDVIDGAAKRGEVVSVNAIADTLNRTRKTFGDSLFADDLLPHVDRAEELLRTHKNTVGDAMPIDKARSMKTDLHKALKGAYGELSSITDEAMKDIVHGINEEVWKKYPILKEAGQEMRVQIALERELERAVNRLGNNNGISLQDIGLAATAGASGGGLPLAVTATFANKVLRMPSIKGVIARNINKMGKKGFNERQKGLMKESLSNLSIAGREQKEQ